MKILFIGDIVGAPGREAIKRLLPQIKKEYSIEFTIANIENAAGGVGVTPRIVDELWSYDLDILTTGDHVWNRREILTIIDSEDKLLRPANFPEGIPGKGYCIIENQGRKLGVVNLQGRVFMAPVVRCPFRVAIENIEKIKSKTPIILVDVHAEATSEKIAMGHFLDGQVSAVVGSHTHVQTADEKILSQGTAYITDVGMSGPCDSVIGQRKDKIIERFLTGMPVRFEVASGDVQLQGVIIDIEERTGKASSIQRLQRRL
jgi:hypothetical protein